MKDHEIGEVRLFIELGRIIDGQWLTVRKEISLFERAASRHGSIVEPVIDEALGEMKQASEVFFRDRPA